MAIGTETSYLVAGAGGMLGTALRQVLTGRGTPFEAPDERSFDITDRVAVEKMVGRFASGVRARGVLVNAAAYTDVERAEDEAAVAYRVNEDGARNLAEAARAAGLGFVHISTDFVFDGAKAGAYTEDDETNPLSIYGASKRAGERAVREAYPEALVVRTAWAFGPGGVNFPSKILGLARQRQQLSVVTDEVGSPTFTVDLAGGIVALLEVGAEGLLHLTGAGSCSRFELAAEVLRLAGLRRDLVPVSTNAFPSRVARPANSVLDCSKAAALGVTMPSWRDGLARFMAAGPTEG